MAAVSSPRAFLAGGVLVVTLLVAVAVTVFASGGSEGGAARTAGPARATLKLERAVLPDTGRPELLVSLPDERLNTLSTTGGKTSVLLRCVDRGGAVTVRQRHPWPLLEEVGYPPHVHQPALPKVLDALGRCRMVGSRVDFAGRVPGGGLPASQ